MTSACGAPAVDRARSRHSGMSSLPCQLHLEALHRSGYRGVIDAQERGGFSSPTSDHRLSGLTGPDAPRPTPSQSGRWAASERPIATSHSLFDPLPSKRVSRRELNRSRRRGYVGTAEEWRAHIPDDGFEIGSIHRVEHAHDEVERVAPLLLPPVLNAHDCKTL